MKKKSHVRDAVNSSGCGANRAGIDHFAGAEQPAQQIEAM